MNENEMIYKCPVCGDQCAVQYGCGYGPDFIYCSCGYEKELETSTNFDYSE